MGSSENTVHPFLRSAADYAEWQYW